MVDHFRFMKNPPPSQQFAAFPRLYRFFLTLFTSKFDWKHLERVQSSNWQYQSYRGTDDASFLIPGSPGQFWVVPDGVAGHSANLYATFDYGCPFKLTTYELTNAVGARWVVAHWLGSTHHFVILNWLFDFSSTSSYKILGSIDNIHFEEIHFASLPAALMARRYTPTPPYPQPLLRYIRYYYYAILLDWLSRYLNKTT